MNSITNDELISAQESAFNQRPNAPMSAQRIPQDISYNKGRGQQQQLSAMYDSQRDYAYREYESDATTTTNTTTIYPADHISSTLPQPPFPSQSQPRTQHHNISHDLRLLPSPFQATHERPSDVTLPPVPQITNEEGPSSRSAITQEAPLKPRRRRIPSGMQQHMFMAMDAAQIKQLSKGERKKLREHNRNLVCYNCGATTTPLWRRTVDRKNNLCNACGLYYKQYKISRPVKNTEQSRQLPPPPTANHIPPLPHASIIPTQATPLMASLPPPSSFLSIDQLAGPPQFSNSVENGTHFSHQDSHFFMSQHALPFETQRMQQDHHQTFRRLPPVNMESFKDHSFHTPGTHHATSPLDPLLAMPWPMPASFPKENIESHNNRFGLQYGHTENSLNMGPPSPLTNEMLLSNH
ncbi:hypothetical protein CcCBS67573_g04874 [Chytriomyces confervae]|uniref:GATA-type domain-containing protein n=1 Tax=Chytriomyces confervae TaxID=246404 RepID=A0A507FCC1_9FUNG|nr:hypothetical protein CcCBS67573_g04874 [Chytriomyces confervae]